MLQALGDGRPVHPPALAPTRNNSSVELPADRWREGLQIFRPDVITGSAHQRHNSGTANENLAVIVVALGARDREGFAVRIRHTAPPREGLLKLQANNEVDSFKGSVEGADCSLFAGRRQ